MPTSGPPSFPAARRGWCARCDNDVQKGEQILFDRDDQIIHADCPVLTKAPEPPPCPTCWIVPSLAGECENCD